MRLVGILVFHQLVTAHFTQAPVGHGCDSGALQRVVLQNLRLILITGFNPNNNNPNPTFWKNACLVPRTQNICTAVTSWWNAGILTTAYTLNNTNLPYFWVNHLLTVQNIGLSGHKYFERTFQD